MGKVRLSASDLCTSNEPTASVAFNVTGYDSANQVAYLDAMLRWGLDWLMDVSKRVTIRGRGE